MYEDRRKTLIDATFDIQNQDFNEVALSLFAFQYEYNAIYRNFVDFLKINIKKIDHFEKIPCLPIQFFKQYDIKTGVWEQEDIFTSSGTTGQITSKHYVRSVKNYIENTKIGFEKFYGPIENHCVLALLPSYLERSGSSLVVMAEEFIRCSQYAESGFFLYDYQKIMAQLLENQRTKTPTLLLGVTFALMDLAETFKADLSDIIIMETGGMKGRRKEITRQEFHDVLKKSFKVENIHSEYGMTELCSQGYSKGNGIFETCDTLKILIKEINDPFAQQSFGKNGVVNVIDLANIDSCAFIATEDLGVFYENNTFEIKGRLDNSEMRGCNLMVE